MRRNDARLTYARVMARRAHSLSSSVAKLAALLVAVAIMHLAPRAQAQDAANDDFSTRNVGWNGLSELVEVARREGVTVEVTPHLVLGELAANDAVILIHPTSDLPATGLTAFLRAGGRVALADDFGHGDSLLNVFRIVRAEPERSAGVLRLRGNPELLVARPQRGHPLGDGVTALVTNHPRVLRHPQLEPIFLLEGNDAIVLAGAVGEGRLVAISDPSVLINNMLQLASNRQFAANLVSYLRGETNGRVIIVEAGGEVTGMYGDPNADRPLHDLRSALERAASLELPPLVLRILAVSLLAIMLILIAGSTPRTSPYQASAMFREEPVQGGLVGRVEWYGARPTDLLDPTLVYKLELESTVASLLGLSVRTPIHEMQHAMRSLSVPAAMQNDARALFDELAQLATSAANGMAAPVTEGRLKNIVDRGEAITQALRNAVAQSLNAADVKERA